MRGLIEKKLNARELQATLGVSYKTAWTWCHKLRRAMRGAQPHVPPPTLADELAKLNQLERLRAVQRLKRGELLVLETHHPEGRPCCGRLDRTEWAVPRDDPGDETDRVGPHGVYADPAMNALVERLWERFHGGLSRKHLAAYAEEDQYVFTRKGRERRDVLTTLALLAVRTRPFPYQAIVESPRPQLPAVVEATLPAALREERETRAPRTGPPPREEPVDPCQPVRLDDETIAQLRLDGVSLERRPDRPRLPP